jgi:hypothetical protein
MASVGQQNTRYRQIVGHDQIEAETVGSLPRGDLRPHRQPWSIDEEGDPGREVVGGPENDPVDRFPTGRTRTAKTLSRSPPLAPAASLSGHCLRNALPGSG